jgi:CxxC-x17-CxxC domain-containing protein
MHEAICATCGKSCEVPFRPTGDKPVYCSDCFGKGSKSSAGPRNDNSKEQFNSLNAKLYKIIKFLMRTELKETEVKKPVEKKEKKVVAKKEIVKIEKKEPAKAKEKKVAKKKGVSKKKK